MANHFQSRRLSCAGLLGLFVLSALLPACFSGWKASKPIESIPRRIVADKGSHSSPMPAWQKPFQQTPVNVEPSTLPSLAFAMLFAALCFFTPGVALATDNLAAVAPCLLSKCQLPLAKCILNPSCAADLTCVIACSGRPDESSCQINCGNNFENETVVEFNACALSAKKCVPQRPDTGPVPGDAKWDPVKGRYPEPPADAVSDDFEVAKMTGKWYITAGLNPLFDTFDCQVHFFEGMAPKENSPGRLVGKINWRINEVDGEFISRSTVQSFVQTKPFGKLENRGNEYLNYQDDWFVLDHADEDDPELGFVLIYYRGKNDAWAGYGGGTLYTRAKTLPPQILDRVREATAKAKVPFDKFWKATDNSCPVEGDPQKLRAQYAERLIEQAELGAEEQLTRLARKTISKVDMEEREIAQAAKRLEKLTEKFVREELKVTEKAIEEEELALEAPFRKLKQFFTPKSSRR